MEWNIGEAAGALAAHAINTKQSTKAIRADSKRLQAFQALYRSKVLSWLGRIYIRSSEREMKAVLALALAASAFGQNKQPLRADVVIYGGTPGGLAAAQAVVRAGASAVVIEPTSHIGGMVTGGIAITDTATPQFVGGIAAEFFDEVAAQQKRNNPQPAKPILRFRGRDLPWRTPVNWDLEPKTARLVFEKWARQAGIQVDRWATRHQGRSEG